MTTISFIEQYLADCNVNGVTKQFDKGIPVALFFHVELGQKKFTIRLPAKVAAVHEFLWRDYCTSHIRPRKTKEDFMDQAARTAWAIQRDWVQVQMSLIKLKQVDFLEVFMGFIFDGEHSYYDRVKGGGFKLLPESTGGN